MPKQAVAVNHHDTSNPPRVANVLVGAALAGAVLTLLAYRFGPLGIVQALVVLGAATIVPLGASLSLLPDRRGRTSNLDLTTVAFVAAVSLLLPISAWLPRGVQVGAAVAHVVSATLLALSALRRLAWRGLGPLEEVAIDVASLMLPVGALFLLASRTTGTLLGFEEPIVGFTAAHFHYAGFAAPMVLGGLGRFVFAYGHHTTRIYRMSTCVVIVAVPLTALGINGGAMLERSAALLLALGMTMASVHAFVVLVRLPRRHFLPRTVLAGSFVGLVAPMALAATFAWTGSAGRGRALSQVVPLADMIALHGVVNALVFALPALTTLALVRVAPRHIAGGFPMSRLRGGLRVGADYFARTGALGRTRRPTGIVDRVDAYRSDTFEPSVVHPDVKRFYEHTAAHDLEVVPAWRPGFLLGGKLWRAIARRIGQVELPTERTGTERVQSRIVDLDDTVDGRIGARGWIRTYEASGRALYVAAYTGTPSGERLLMNIAFPLPFSALVSVLRFDGIGTPGGLRVTTDAPPGELVSDEGIYIATRFFVLRLPMREWVEVVPTDVPGETRARHELFLLGARYLTLDYRITAKP